MKDKCNLRYCLITLNYLIHSKGTLVPSLRLQLPQPNPCDGQRDRFAISITINQGYVMHLQLMYPVTAMHSVLVNNDLLA